MDINTPPDIVFLIPYRDRLPQKEFFLRYMKYILEDYEKDTYKIVFCHQQDKRTFNRGAMKNAGFNYIKTTYPEYYQKITMVFHDIDCVPYIKNLLDYKTSFGKIKHFYGFEHALGGIVSISCYDFESINGFPNFWGWGFEDNALQNRITNKGKFISRKIFFKIGDNRILHLFDTFKKEADENIPRQFLNDNGETGLSTLKINKSSIEKVDIIIPHIILNINDFHTEFEYSESNIILKDIRDNSSNYINTKKINNINKNKQVDNKPNQINKNINNKNINNNNINNNNINNNMVFNNIPSRKCELKNGECNGNICENTNQKMVVVRDNVNLIENNNTIKSNTRYKKKSGMFSWKRS